MKPGSAAALLLGLAAAPAMPAPQGTAPGDRALPADLDLRA